MDLHASDSDRRSRKRLRAPASVTSQALSMDRRHAPAVEATASAMPAGASFSRTALQFLHCSLHVRIVMQAIVAVIGHASRVHASARMAATRRMRAASACRKRRAPRRTRMRCVRVTHSGSSFEMQCARHPCAALSVGLRRFDHCDGSSSAGRSTAPRRCGGRNAIAGAASAAPAMRGLTSRSTPAANGPAVHRRCIRRRCRPPRRASPPCSRLRSRSRYRSRGTTACRCPATAG